MDARGAGWGITAGLDPEMALLAEHLLKPLPADKQIETGPFLEAVSHLPPFFGEPGWVGDPACSPAPERPRTYASPPSPEHPQTVSPLDAPNPSSPAIQDPLSPRAPSHSPPRPLPAALCLQQVVFPVSSRTPSPSSPYSPILRLPAHLTFHRVLQMPPPQFSASLAPPVGHLPKHPLLSQMAVSAASPCKHRAPSPPKPVIPHPIMPFCPLGMALNSLPLKLSCHLINPLFSLKSPNLSLGGLVNPSSLRIPPF